MRALICAITAMALSGCATTRGTTEQQSADDASIKIAVGPCFGFCPVYEVSISSAGRVEFDGQRHTEVIGKRDREAGTGTYRQVAAELAAFRPKGARAEPARVRCSAAVTDTPSYTVTWTTASGAQSVATHQAGCPSGPGHDLDAVLKDMPRKLGIDGWSKQITRTGTSRG